MLAAESLDHLQVIWHDESFGCDGEEMRTTGKNDILTPMANVPLSSEKLTGSGGNVVNYYS
ncbi:MAG: hypothetical protein HGB15_07475 [Chlorobaculum sp.]|nr:hypothetical protein [Chlorobaculum sp.]